jgi:hypothetical protein
LKELVDKIEAALKEEESHITHLDLRDRNIGTPIPFSFENCFMCVVSNKKLCAKEPLDSGQ